MLVSKILNYSIETYLLPLFHRDCPVRKSLGISQVLRNFLKSQTKHILTTIWGTTKLWCDIGHKSQEKHCTIQG
jgi:hypothetical protein